MSGEALRALIRRVAWRVIAGALLAGLSMPAALAQQPAADANGSAHAQFLKMVPAKHRPLPTGAPNVVDRNAIGVAVIRHDAAPAAPVPLVGGVAVGAPALQPIGAGALAIRGSHAAQVQVPGAAPPVSSRGAIGGASYTRPGMALLPLGGPVKSAATGINGTGIRPKH